MTSSNDSVTSSRRRSLSCTAKNCRNAKLDKRRHSREYNGDKYKGDFVNRDRTSSQFGHSTQQELLPSTDYNRMKGDAQERERTADKHQAGMQPDHQNTHLSDDQRHLDKRERNGRRFDRQRQQSEHVGHNDERDRSDDGEHYYRRDDRDKHRNEKEHFHHSDFQNDRRNKDLRRRTHDERSTSRPDSKSVTSPDEFISAHIVKKIKKTEEKSERLALLRTLKEEIKQEQQQEVRRGVHFAAAPPEEVEPPLEQTLETNSGEERAPSPEKPNFEPSGLLLEESNVKNGVIMKYTEPQDAKKPTEKWRLYVFKGNAEKELKTLHLHRSSYFLVGKEPRVAEVLLVHPTISKQHAVIQFRHRFGKILPYIVDLESTNGSYLNGEKIESLRFFELRHGDTLKFGKSSRDLVVIKESEAEIIETESYRQFADREVDAIEKKIFAMREIQNDL